MAPTGLAAKRMAESTGMNSSTIHKACGLVPANNPSGFTAQGDCTICGFIGIDEMSMVGEHLFAYAIDAVLSSPSTRIVLLGDTDQLAPVARGDVLRDLIKCGVIKPFALMSTIGRGVPRRLQMLPLRFVRIVPIPGIPEILCLIMNFASFRLLTRIKKKKRMKS